MTEAEASVMGKLYKATGKELFDLVPYLPPLLVDWVNIVFEQSRKLESEPTWDGNPRPPLEDRVFEWRSNMESEWGDAFAAMKGAQG